MTNEDLLTKRLHQLADSIVPPPHDARSDLQRGRRLQRRNRTAIAVGAVAVVGAVTVGAAMLPRSGPTALDPSNGGPTAGGPTASTGIRNLESDEAPDAKMTRGSFPNRFGAPPGARAALREYNNVLAEHLDPSRQHLEQYDGVGFTGGSDEAGPNEVGAKFSWTTTGQNGEGMLHVAVSRTWVNSQIYLAHKEWRPLDAILPAGWTAEIAKYDGGMAVVVHRADGVHVAIDANTLFGNNSLTSVTEFRFATSDLVAAASDKRLSFPS